ncbi:MAG: hypothetical protein HFH72_16565 [Lachnospiraceae bacterium]|nr:hypothetical protein [Lachnospiraceae bacterium]
MIPKLISMGTVKCVMAKLQKDGIIICIGNNRSGKWQVNESMERELN